MQIQSLTFAGFFTTEETRPAVLALEEVVHSLTQTNAKPKTNPVFLYGPAGIGKTHLVQALIEEVIQNKPSALVTSFTAREFAGKPQSRKSTKEGKNADLAAKECDLFIVEDLQNLPLKSMGTFSKWIDDILRRQQQLVLTANTGPKFLQQHKGFSTRLVNRLNGGLPVRLRPLSPTNRLALLKNKRSNPDIPEETLDWLAMNLKGGNRQVLNALQQVEMLLKVEGSLDVSQVAKHFQDEVRMSKVTVERITKKVGGFFQVEPGHLRSRKRYRSIVVPRQISMYLARLMTNLSLDQIGDYFGGRDHTTVLHACRKVEQALHADSTIQGAVRQLQTTLM